MTNQVLFHSMKISIATLVSILTKKPRILTCQIMINNSCNQNCLYCCVTLQVIYHHRRNTVRMRATYQLAYKILRPSSVLPGVDSQRMKSSFACNRRD